MKVAPMLNALRHIALILLIVLTTLLPAGAGPGQAGAQETVTMESLTCFWSAVRADGQLTLSGPATELMTITVSSNHPELLWPNSGGEKTYQVAPGYSGFYWYADGADLVLPASDTPVEVYADSGTDRVSCTFVIPFVPPTPTPTATPTQVPFVLESVVCGPWDPLDDMESFVVTVTLSQVVVSDYQVRLTTDRPDMVHWPDDGTRWLTVPAGSSQGDVRITGKNFSPIDDTVITIFAHDQGVTLSCQQFERGTHDTATPIVTGTAPTRIPTLVVTPKPTRTATVAVPPALRTIYTQVGSRSGNLTKITVCLDRSAPSGGVMVGLDSSDPSLIPVPGQIAIPFGRECLSTNVLVGATNRTVPVTVTATLGARSFEGTTTVRPQRPVVYTQTVSRAGGTSKVTVCARTQGESISLASDNADIFPVPASVALPSGKVCLSLLVPVGPVTGDVPVTITATFTSGVATGTTVVRDLDLPT
jgi:hypothetical protein